MKRTHWKQKLSKAEREHLKESMIRTMDDLKEQVKFLKEQKALRPDAPHPCWHCQMIAQKVGVWG